MLAELAEARCVTGARLICSMWPGYLRDPKTQPLHTWLSQHGISLDECHTSGHAAVQDLQRLRHAFPKSPLVPIHTAEPARFQKLFENTQLHDDGEWWSVC